MTSKERVLRNYHFQPVDRFTIDFCAESKVYALLREHYGVPDDLALMERLHVDFRPSEAEEKTASGLVIPDTAKEKPQQGEVLAVGPGRRADTTGEIIPLDVSVGDTVVYSKYGGTEIAVEGEDLLILTGRDVLAKV